MASTSSSSSTNSFQRNLRPFKAPLKALHTQEDCSAESTSKVQPCLPLQPTRETTKRYVLNDVTNEHDAFADSSAPSVKRPRAALGTLALVATHQHCTPQHLQQTPHYLSAVCSVLLPPLYGCCDDLPVGHEGVRTRSMETQTSGMPNDFCSK